MLSLSVALVSCHSSQQALKLMEKSKYEQAQTKLDKSLTKDSLNAATHYVYSLLFVDTAYQHYQVDSAYFHILEAISDYQATDIKTKQKLTKKLGLDSISLIAQKLVTDSLAFSEVSGIHTVTAYQRFIDEHASSAPQYEEAIRQRNQLAFSAAKKIDTYQAYKNFMDTYPDADQYELAKERYNTLAFREKTKGGNMESYLNFLKAFPNSPYRPNAEEQIMKISVADNLLKHYAAFARQYPQSPSAKLSVDILYHLYKAKHDPGNFLKEFPQLPYADSLQKIIKAEKKLLIPILENERYGFMDSQGRIIIPPQYPLISAKYLCEGVLSDFIAVASTKGSKMQHSLLTKNGKPITTLNHDEIPQSFPGPFTSNFITDVGMGWLLVQEHPGKYVVRHKAGYRIMPELYELLDTIEFITSPLDLRQEVPFQFIKFQAEGLWGIMTFTGKTLLEAAYDNIEEYDHFIVVEKGGKLAVTNRDALIKKADNIPLELSFSYEDVALIDNRYLIAYADEYETALNQQLQAEVPLGNYNIVRRLNGGHQWLLKKEVTRQFVRNDSLISVKQPAYFLYDSQTNGLPHEYKKAFYNEKWLALQKGKGFDFFDFTSNTTSAAYDSVKILSENLVLLFQKDSITAHFSNQNKLNFARFSDKKELQFRLIKSMSEGSLALQKEYLIILKPDKKQVIDQQGHSLFASSMDEITAYPYDLFVIEKNGKKGLVDSTGNNLIPIKYQSIGNYKDRMLAIFDDQKFGFYYHNAQTFVKPEYEAVVQFYGQHFSKKDSLTVAMFIARKKGKYGIINQENKSLTPFAFEQIQFWNDTTALVKTGEEWQLYWLTAPAGTPKENRVLLEGVKDFEELTAGEERLLKIYKGNVYGIISDIRGEIMPPTYDEIILLSNESDYIFVTEKYIPEAELYIIIHLDHAGKMLKRQALTTEQYDKIYCDDAYL